ncbi:hypothetical protein GCM10009430_44090 [Aquimarina litoralis]|uniref:Kazal-type serine protease inhibitor domain-containing protein n=1 Tax=Aquimarina litoralis TaxID=584605 RepID=A0ABP3UE89_9FLAO
MIKTIKLTKLILVLAFLSLCFACEQDSDIGNEKEISISEVKNIFDQKQRERLENNGSAINIDWNRGAFKNIAEKDGLVFPLKNVSNKYISNTDNGTNLHSILTNSYALAYKENGDIQLKLIQIIPTEQVHPLTGYVTVEDWNGNSNGHIIYKDGQVDLKQSSEFAKSLDCTITYYYDCTRVTVGGEVVSDECVLSGTSVTCVSDEIPTFAGDGAIGGGGPGSGSTSGECPHPYINGLTIPCGEILCEEGFVKDQYGNCVLEDNSIKLKKNQNRIGKISFNNSSKAEIAAHVLNYIRFCVENNISEVNLENIFSDFPIYGIFETFHTEIIFNGELIEIYIEIPVDRDFTKIRPHIGKIGDPFDGDSKISFTYFVNKDVNFPLPAFLVRIPSYLDDNFIDYLRGK